MLGLGVRGAGGASAVPASTKGSARAAAPVLYMIVCEVGSSWATVMSASAYEACIRRGAGGAALAHSIWISSHESGRLG